MILSHNILKQQDFPLRKFLLKKQGESGQVKDITKPFNVIYGRKGRAAISIKIFGRKAHAAEAHKGINALDEAVTFISLIKKMKLPKHPRLGSTDIVFQIMHADTDSSFSLPEKCYIQFSLLTIPSLTIKDFLKQLELLAKENNIHAEIGVVPRKTDYADRYEVDTKNTFLKLLEDEWVNIQSLKTVEETYKKILQLFNSTQSG